MSQEISTGSQAFPFLEHGMEGETTALELMQLISFLLISVGRKSFFQGRELSPLRGEKKDGMTLILHLPADWHEPSRAWGLVVHLSLSSNPQPSKNISSTCWVRPKVHLHCALPMVNEVPVGSLYATALSSPAVIPSNWYSVAFCLQQWRQTIPITASSH